jgi:signal peptide peptidase SppA
MYFEQILQTFYGTHWAILPERLYEMETVLLRVIADRFEGRVAAYPVPGHEAQQPRDYAAPGDVAVIPVRGTIYPRGGASPASGLTTAEYVGKQIDGAAANSQIGHIVLDMDTPGGAVSGVPELAAKVRAAAGRKPVTAVANHLSASAGYWLMAQATEAVVTPSGSVGSIGVKYTHIDRSKALEDAGVRVTELTTSPLKALGSPFRPLSDEARASIQAMILKFHAMFVGDVARGRRVTVDRVESGFGRGDVLTAEDARAAGMVDRVATLEDVIADIRAKSARRRAAAMA